MGSFVSRRGSAHSAQATQQLVMAPSSTRSTATVPSPAEMGMPARSLLSAGLTNSPSRSGSAKMAKKPTQLTRITSRRGSRFTGAIRKRQRVARTTVSTNRSSVAMPTWDQRTDANCCALGQDGHPTPLGQPREQRAEGKRDEQLGEDARFRRGD